MHKKIARSFSLYCVLLTILTVSALGADHAASSGKYFVYVGTYTQGNSKGIYAYRYDDVSGDLTSLGLAAESVNPSFLAVPRSQRFVYAVNETGDYQGKSSGAVSAFAINRNSGKLTLLNQVPSRGADPCYVSFDKSGKHALVANYTGGSVAMFPAMRDGRVGEASAFVQHSGSSVDHERQEGPHAHSIDLSPDNRFAVAADLGADQLMIYRFDAARGALAPNHPGFVKLEAGSGPRHFKFHPSGKFAYVINELRSSVTAFAYDAAGGSLRELQTISMLPRDFSGHNDGAELEIHPSGKFLYASNRGHDSIAVFSIDTAKGMLTPLQDVPSGGKTPRNFVVDPTGSRLFVANQDSNNIVIFRIDPHTGRLTPTGQVLEVPAPVCVRFARIR